MSKVKVSGSKYVCTHGKFLSFFFYTQECFVLILVEIGPMVMETKVLILNIKFEFKGR